MKLGPRRIFLLGGMLNDLETHENCEVANKFPHRNYHVTLTFYLA